MNIGVDIDGVLTDLERMALDFGTKMCVEENIPIELNLSKYWEIEKYNWTKEQEKAIYEPSGKKNYSGIKILYHM